MNLVTVYLDVGLSCDKNITKKTKNTKHKSHKLCVQQNIIVDPDYDRSLTPVLGILSGPDFNNNPNTETNPNAGRAYL